MAGGRTVILGGGFGGLVTALRLARRRGDDEVVLVDARSAHVYTPWLYEASTGLLLEQRASAKASMERIAAIPYKACVKKYPRSRLRFRQAEIVGVDLKSKHVLLKGEKTLAYERLVVALGSEAETFNIPGVKTYAHTMKSIDDAQSVRDALMHIFADIKKTGGRKTVVIVGAGATGVEMAGEMANFLRRCARAGMCAPDALRIVLLEAEQDILMPFSRRIRRLARKRLLRLGVEIMTDTMVVEAKRGQVIVDPRSFSPEEMRPSTSPFVKRSHVPTDVLIWSGGIRPAHVLEAFALPKDRRGRIKITPQLQVEGHPDVFAIGDATSLTVAGRQAAPTAAVALRQAARLAENIVARIEGRTLKPFVPTKRGSWVIPIGGAFAIASIEGFVFTGRLAFWLHRLIDLRYFLQILPAHVAWSLWRERTVLMQNNN